ncbi:MAG: response regulator [Polyangiaceae bacterium]
METPHETTYSGERHARILVAEDDVEMRRLVIESLRADGHEAVDVTDGGQLLIQITNFYRLRPDPEPIDLVVTDIRMPVCSGLEIVEALRNAHWTTPIVIMTAFGDGETRTRAKDLGAVLLDKPFKMKTLREIVRVLLLRRTTPPED